MFIISQPDSMLNVMLMYNGIISKHAYYFQLWWKRVIQPKSGETLSGSQLRKASLPAATQTESIMYME